MMKNFIKQNWRKLGEVIVVFGWIGLTIWYYIRGMSKHEVIFYKFWPASMILLSYPVLLLYLLRGKNNINRH